MSLPPSDFRVDVAVNDRDVRVTVLAKRVDCVWKICSLCSRTFLMACGRGLRSVCFVCAPHGTKFVGNRSIPSRLRIRLGMWSLFGSEEQKREPAAAKRDYDRSYQASHRDASRNRVCVYQRRYRELHRQSHNDYRRRLDWATRYYKRNAWPPCVRPPKGAS